MNTSWLAIHRTVHQSLLKRNHLLPTITTARFPFQFTSLPSRYSSSNRSTPVSTSPPPPTFTAFDRPDILVPSKSSPPHHRHPQRQRQLDLQLQQQSPPLDNKMIYSSPRKDVILPPPCSIFHYQLPPPSLRKQDTKNTLPKEFDGNLPAYIEAATGKQYTRHELLIKSRSIGLGLLSHFGDSESTGPSRENPKVILIFSPNSIHYPLVFFGAQSARYITTLANAGYTSNELAHQIMDSRCCGAFVHPDLLETYMGALEVVNKKGGEGKDQVKELKRSTWLGVPKDELKGGEMKGIKSFEELWKGVDKEKAKTWEGIKVGKGGENDVAILCYSSGTTGLAKGVMTTHKNLSSDLEMIRPTSYPGVPNKDSTIGVLPFYHIYGIVVVMLFPLTQGVPVIVLPRFEPTAFLTAIQKYKITFMNIVPPIIVFLANSPIVEKFDITSLNGIMSGAAPLGDGLTKKAMDRMKVIVSQGYGLTETSPVTHMMELHEAPSHLGSVGKLLPNMTARIIDLDGNDVKQGVPGELIMKGPNVMKGYWRNEKATKGTFTEDGWYRTGDIAQIDKEGYWFIVDRLKELIKYKGFQVPPADLEAVLLTHPKVGDVGVVGVMDHEQATEVPRAYVVPSGGLESLKNDEERKKFCKEVVDWTAKTVSNHKKLRGGVVLIDAIPKSAAGKILRRELRLLAQKDEAKKPAAKL